MEPETVAALAAHFAPDFNSILLFGLLAWVWRIDIKLREVIIRQNEAAHQRRATDHHRIAP